MALPFASVGAPMAPPMGGGAYAAPSLSPAPDPSANLMALLDQVGKPPLQPMYPPGYKPPKKPEIGDILSRAEAAKAANQAYLDLVADTYRRIRQQTFGYLNDRDIEARKQNRQRAYPSTALIDALNRFVNFLAARPLAFSVDVYDPELYQDAQKIEDFAYYLRKQHERAWVKAGNQSLAQSEAKDLAIYGAVVSRRTLDPENPKCPIRAALIDPATVFPVIGKVGAYTELQSVYHVYTTTASQAIAEWVHGDIPKNVRDALGDKLSATGDSANVDLVEYWDTWYCGTFILGTDVAVKPIVEHKYGCVPYIIQYGPGGEAMHTRNPSQSTAPFGDDWGTGSGDAERIYKATGFLEPMKKLHDLVEGVGARALDGFIKGFNQPLQLKRTAEAMATMEPPQIDREEGGVTTLAAGEEELLPFPTSPPPQETNMLMQMLGTDLQSNRLGSNQGMPDKSNISGTALSRAAEDGREIESGWIEAMELFHGRCLTYDVKTWRNFGHVHSNYNSGSKKAYFIPRRNPTDTESKSFELTPEIIDNVDTEVVCSMNSLRMSELIPFGQAAQMFGPKGLKVWSTRLIAEKMGVTDYDRISEIIRSDNLIEAATDLPEFKKLLVPAALKTARRAVEGNPELEAMYDEMLADWETLIAQPNRMQLEAQARNGGQPPAGPQGPQGVPQPGQGIAGGAGAPYQQLNQGPGSQGGVVGAPTGLQGDPTATG